jgi:hypothetical protein
MRLAGSNEYFDQLSASSQKQNSANQFETVIEQIELLREKGLGSDAAIHHGLNIWNGTEDAVQPSPRFAAIFGDDSADDSESSNPD